MKCRSVLLTLAAAALLVPAQPSMAAPFLGRVNTATTKVQLRGTDKVVYQVEYVLTVVQPQGGTASYTFDIRIARCADGGCTVAKRYTLRPSASQVTTTDDMSEASVRVTTLGTPITISWSANADRPPLARAELSVAGSDGSYSFNEDPSASARVTAWGATCSAPGTSMSAVVVSDAGYGTAAGPTPSSSTPPQFAKRSQRKVTCVG